MVDEILRVEAVSKRFDRTRALTGVSFQVRCGERVALVGLNGAGKTTLLRILAGVLLPTTGGVIMAGRTMEAAPERAALLPADNIAPEPDWTPSSYLSFIAAMVGAPNTEDIPRLAARLGLTPWMDKPIRALSSGNRRKVELIRMTLNRASLLLFDEPTRELDIPSKLAVWEWIESTAEGAAVIIATHDPAEIERLAHRVLIIREGAIVAEGSRDWFKESLARVPSMLAAASSQASE